MKSFSKAKQIILAALTMMTLILGACAALTNQPGADDQSTQSASSQSAAPTEAAPAAEAPAILWHREGGFAGFCDDIAIYANGDVTVSSCRDNQSEELAHIQLDAAQLATLTEWMARLQAFKSEHKDPSVADAMTIRVLFAGAGNAAASAAEQAAVADFVQSLLNRLGESPTGLESQATEDANVIATDVQYVQALVNVNMRSGPGTNYDVVGSVFEGQIALVTGASPDGGWWRVVCPDGSVGSCFVVNDPNLTQPTSAPGEAAPGGDAAATETVVYEDTTAGFAFDYPATWTVSGGETGSRGAITQLAAPDGTQLDASVLLWDPQNDLGAYVETRKIAWHASGITILQEETWTLSSGQPAMRFIVRGSDGVDTGFFLFAALDGRYLTLSGGGNFEVLDAIGKSLRIGE